MVLIPSAVVPDVEFEGRSLLLDLQLPALVRANTEISICIERSLGDSLRKPPDLAVERGSGSPEFEWYLVQVSLVHGTFHLPQSDFRSASNYYSKPGPRDPAWGGRML